MKYYLLKNDSKCSQSFFNYNSTDSNNKKSYQSYYCLDTKNKTILPPIDLIQKCIKLLVKKGKSFDKDGVTEIVIDRSRYFFCTEKMLLESIKKGSDPSGAIYQFKSIEN